LTDGRFLAGVAALIRDPADHYLFLQRSITKDFAPGVWECVTGRVRQGEGYEEAMHREVAEETGLQVEPECLLGTTHFHRGPLKPDTELLGVVYVCHCPAPQALRLSAEHQNARWASLQEAPAFLQADDPSTRWIRGVVRRADRILSGLPRRWQDIARREGFSL
jgi:8-oxo-dGTP diphosphatase